jgi:hypothetical protein
MIPHSAELVPESYHALSKNITLSKHRVKTGKAPELESEPSLLEISSLTVCNIRCGTEENGYSNPKKKGSKLDNIILMLSVVSLFWHCYFIQC